MKRVASLLEDIKKEKIEKLTERLDREKNINLSDARDFESVTGLGITGKVEDRKVEVGNRKLLEVSGINPDNVDKIAESLRVEGAN